MWILFQTIEPVFWGVTAVFQPGMGVEVAGGGGFGALLVLRKRVLSKERHRERQTRGEGQCAGEGSIWLVPFIFRNCRNLVVTLFIILLSRIRAPFLRKLLQHLISPCKTKVGISQSIFLAGICLSLSRWSRSLRWDGPPWHSGKSFYFLVLCCT